MVAGALLTNGLPLWNGDILFFNVPEVITLRGDLPVCWSARSTAR